MCEKENWKTFVGIQKIIFKVQNTLYTQRIYTQINNTLIKLIDFINFVKNIINININDEMSQVLNYY